jgi:glycerol-3-phosphate dehydrogenase
VATILLKAGANYDLVIIGGGINGAGIARDAAGRGLSVLLVEKNDLASATSSWSSKLIHGGLRWLLKHWQNGKFCSISHRIWSNRCDL